MCLIYSIYKLLCVTNSVLPATRSLFDCTWVENRGPSPETWHLYSPSVAYETFVNTTKLEFPKFSWNSICVDENISCNLDMLIKWEIFNYHLEKYLRCFLYWHQKHWRTFSFCFVQECSYKTLYHLYIASDWNGTGEQILI